MSAWDEVDRFKKALSEGRFTLDRAISANAKTLKLSPDRARTLKAESRIANGFHPLNGRPLLPQAAGSGPVRSCGNCKHLREKETPARAKHFKCALWGDTNGPGTDLRKKWPACDLWEVKP